MMQLEVSSFFNQGEWKPVDLETFKRMARPADDEELDAMLKALKAGQCVLSVFGISKFRAALEADSGPRPERLSPKGRRGALKWGAGCLGTCLNYVNKPLDKY